MNEVRFDFHVHSTYSDGEYSVTELASMAKEGEMGGFALTDHDTTEGWQDISAAEREFGITILPGVEISTEWKEKDVHILAYGLTEKSENTLALLASIRKSRVERIEIMVEKCRCKGLGITKDDVFRIGGKGSLGRPHVAKALVEKGYVDSIKEAFQRYLGRGCSCYVPREKISPFHCVEMVKVDGGYPVLAHPGIDKNFRLVKQLKEYGLWGLEAYHSAHNQGEEMHFLQMAKEDHLKVFAGSDFHGFHQDGHGKIGSKFIEIENIAEMFRWNEVE